MKNIIIVIIYFFSSTLIFSISSMIMVGGAEYFRHSHGVIEDLSRESIHTSVLKWMNLFHIHPHDKTAANTFSVEFYETLYCPERPQFAALQATGISTVDDMQLLFTFYTSERWFPFLRDRYVLQSAGWFSAPFPERNLVRTSDISIRYRFFWSLNGVSYIDDELQMYRFYTQLTAHPNNITSFIILPLIGGGVFVAGCQLVKYIKSNRRNQ